MGVDERDSKECRSRVWEVEKRVMKREGGESFRVLEVGWVLVRGRGREGGRCGVEAGSGKRERDGGREV